jgi:hypothetical protein
LRALRGFLPPDDSGDGRKAVPRLAASRVEML